ncbi:MAG: right-handed parallel beta-helix repeat-containing protein [Nitriliruptoraceae bacterium]
MVIGARRVWMVVALLVLATTVLACSAEPDPVAEAEAVREQRCDAEIPTLAETLTALATLSSDVSAEEHLSGQVPPRQPQAQAALERQAALVASLGCERTSIRSRLQAATTSTLLPDPIAASVGQELAARLVGEEPPGPVQRTVTTDEDLARVAAAVPVGSVLTLAEGEHRPSEPIRIVRDLELRGAGRDETTVTIDTAGTALVAQEPAKVRLSGLTIAHEASSTVAVVQLPPTRTVLRDVRITGGMADDEGGGTGVVLGATDTATGVPGPLAALGGSGLDATLLLDVEVVDNAGPGIVVGGAAKPRILRAEVRDNGLCGVCYLDRAGGVLVDSEVAGSEIGVLVSGTAAPRLTRTRLVDNLDAGLVLEDRAAGRYLDVRVERNGERGVLVTDDASGSFEDLMVVDNATFGIAVTDRAAVTLLRTDAAGNEHALWIESDAEVSSDDGRYADSIEVAVVVRGSARLTGSGNRCEGSPFDVGLFDDAEVALEGDGCVVTDER